VIEGKIVEFDCKIEKLTYPTGISENDFKIYTVRVDENKFPKIKQNSWRKYSIKGEMHELEYDVNYHIIAEELDDMKYGVTYKVNRITVDKPKSLDDMYKFLRSILTFKQAENLFSSYPDIVDKIINGDLDDIDLSKIKGVGEKAFSRIKNKIVDNFVLADLLILLGEDISISMVRRLYDKYTSVELVKKELSENPYHCLCGLTGVGFITADELILKLEKNKNLSFIENIKTSQGRCLYAIQYTLQKNEEEGHTRYHLKRLKEDVEKLVPEAEYNFTSCIKDEEMFHYEMVGNQLFVSNKSTYNTEKYIHETLVEGLNIKNEYDIDVSKYYSIDNVLLSDEQQKLLEVLCKENIVILNGSAGTGKTYTTKAVIEMLKGNEITFDIMAPTGKAAKVINSYTGVEATTIHRGLQYRPPNFYYNTKNKLRSKVIIVDEFSMVDIFLFKHLLEAIDFKNTKLLLIGDNAQLPSVSCGNLLHDLLYSKVIPIVNLSVVFRYDDGGLMKVATDVRDGKPYLDKNCNDKIIPFGENRDYHFVNIHKRETIDNMIGIYNQLLKKYDPKEIMVLTAYKKGEYGSIVLNNYLQMIVNKKQNHSNYIESESIKYYEGDLVIQIKNNYKAKEIINIKTGFDLELDIEISDKKVLIANGETGIIKTIEKDKIIIDFNDVLVVYSAKDMSMVNLGYALTIHKSQGDSVKAIILITPSSHTYMLNSNLIYVGLTRMKKRCFHLGDIKTVNTAVEIKANLERETWMKDLFKTK